MKITFLGVGEAFDETQTNVCLLVEAAGRRMLMECGANAPSAVWNKSTRADYLDGIFVSHFHADHTFGLPALVMRMWEDGRTRPFYLFGPVGSQRYIERMMKMAYPSMVNIPFTLRFRELQRSHRWDDWNLRVVSTRHSVPNLGLRLEAGSPQKVFCYSGDGMFTPTAAKLYTGADLLVHEAYLEDGQTKTHCSLVQLERLQELARPKQMALVHLQRNLRKQKDDILKRYRRRKWTIPEAGDSVTCWVGHQRLVHIVNFESARKLTQVPSGHPCGQLYGLAFQLEIHVDGELNPTTGMVVDFAVLEEAFAPLKAQLDHNYLNELSGLENPTSEVMAEWIWKRLAPELPGLCKLVLWENKRSRVEFCGWKGTAHFLAGRHWAGVPTVAFRVDTTARGKRLLDLGELMREAGYLEGFSFDHDAKEVRFHFAKTPVVLGPNGEIDLDELDEYIRSETSIGKKFDDDLLREIFNLDETGHVWQPEE